MQSGNPSLVASLSAPFSVMVAAGADPLAKPPLDRGALEAGPLPLDALQSATDVRSVHAAFLQAQQAPASDDKQRLTMQMEHIADTNRYMLHVKCDGKAINDLRLTPPEAERLCACYGFSIQELEQSKNLPCQDNLEEVRKVIPDTVIKAVKLAGFGEGGVHKKCMPDLGLLLADEHACGDFQREAAIAEKASQQPALARFVSTQSIVDVVKLGPSLKNIGAMTVGQFPVYDKEKVTSRSLTDELERLGQCANPRERCETAKMLALQYVEILRELHKNNISHEDLHMGNLRVYHVAGKPPQTLLKVIDFGKSTVDGASPPVADAAYSFEKRDVTLGDRINRHLLRSSSSPKMQKHYPLHKLLALSGMQANKIDDELKSIGKVLIKSLERAGDSKLSAADRGAGVDRAFDQASQGISDLMDSQGRVQSGQALNSTHADHLRALLRRNRLNQPRPVGMSEIKPKETL